MDVIFYRINLSKKLLFLQSNWWSRLDENQNKLIDNSLVEIVY
jgi:hypothetical protein